VRKRISQREARRLRKQVADLLSAEQTRRNRWSREYPDGISIRLWTPDAVSMAVFDTAGKLGHIIVCKIDGSQIHFYAVKP
jgi:hypothetical protein